MLTATTENLNRHIPAYLIPECTFEFLEVYFLHLVNSQDFPYYAETWVRGCLDYLKPLAACDLDAYILFERLKERHDTLLMSQAFAPDFSVDLIVLQIFDHFSLAGE